MTLGELNAQDAAAFVRTLGAVFEHSPWVAEGAFAARPFADIEALHRSMVAVVRAAGEARQHALLRAHPELAGRAAVRGELTVESSREQAGAGLAQCTPAEFAQLQELNARYNARFGFPFIVAVKGYDRVGIIAEFARRAQRGRAEETATALEQVARIARLRLDALLT